VFKRKINDPIADLRRAVAELRPGQERLAASRAAKATEVIEARRRLLVEPDVSDAGGATRADAARSSPFKAQAPVLTTRWPSWNGSGHCSESSF
jgi:hypothetical protein